jgi:hypothetical protein
MASQQPMIVQQSPVKIMQQQQMQLIKQQPQLPNTMQPIMPLLPPVPREGYFIFELKSFFS